MRAVLLLEISQLWRRLGGVRGVLLIAALAAAGTLIPMRAGAAIFDPVYMTGYALIAAFFSGTYAIQAWAGPEESAWLDTLDGAGPSDIEVLQAKSLAATAYGFAAWMVIFAASLAALAPAAGGFRLPPWPVAAALAVFAAALSAASANSAALIAVRFGALAQARQAFRLALWFVLLAAIIGTGVYPGLFASLATERTFVLALICLAAALGCAAALTGWLVLRSLADRRISLSINP